MCGIVGVVELTRGQEAELGLLRAMTDTIVHRGPDGEGHTVEGPLGLGHRRLAIIDVAGSPQPMTSADGRFTIVFNGEILNYRQLREALSTEQDAEQGGTRGAGAGLAWRTHGDTEVLLELLARRGVAGLVELRGQFAFGLLDRADGSVLLGRDRLGILPLFHATTADRFAFASEAKALVPAIGAPTIDAESLPDYLTQRAVPAPHTLIAGVSKLAPGSWMRVWPDGRTEAGTYWSLRTPRALQSISPAAAVDRLDGLLRDAIDDALVADVPVGAYLSGGVDSSIIVALTARAAKAARLATFAAAFPGSAHDESAYARRVSERYGTDHHEIAIDPERFHDDLWRLSRCREFPISEASDVAVASLASLASQHVKVVLSGEGSDELFGGYPKYRFARTAELIGALPVGLRQRPLELLRTMAFRRNDRISSALRAFEGAEQADRLRSWFSPYSQREIARLCPARGRRTGPALVRGDDAVAAMCRGDLGSWLSDNLLERGDRMTMASSIELRPPFLDARVVEFALSLPSSVKLHDRTPKWPVRELARRYVDADLIDRPKVGFRVPIGDWFRGRLRTEVEDLLLSGGSHCRRWLDAAYIDELVAEHLSGSADRAKQLWPLVSLEVWARSVLDATPCIDPSTGTRPAP